MQNRRVFESWCGFVTPFIQAAFEISVCRFIGCLNASLKLNFEADPLSLVACSAQIGIECPKGIFMRSGGRFVGTVIFKLGNAGIWKKAADPGKTTHVFKNHDFIRVPSYDMFPCLKQSRSMRPAESYR